jgi:teichuronic acid biosynthesis glycosyltransferase TuaG
MEHCPRVSVVIPVYNYERYIRESVDSCLAQTYPNLEIIVVDDGSKDQTPAILKTYGNKIQVITQSNQGAAVALNKGFRQATGEYVCWLSADDVFLPEKIDKQVKIFSLFPSFDVVYTDFYNIDENGTVTGEFQSDWVPDSRALSRFLKENYINGSSVMLRKTVWEKAGGFNQGIPAAVDGLLWLQLLKDGHKFFCIPEPLLKYRTHSQNQSSNSNLMTVYSDVVYALGFSQIPLIKIHAGNKTDYALFYKGFSHFRVHRYLTYVTTYLKISVVSIPKAVGFLPYLYCIWLKAAYLKKVRAIIGKLSLN